ncbi:hypothetical protein ASG98_19655 [Bacillus sp. Soil531]|nr:hypothetical protein ASG98_19655 [Bacillus sp. Soil531]
MGELIKALPSLLGVIVGGLITFFIQQITIRKQQSWEKKKLELDNFYKNEEIKFKTFNKILELNGEHQVLEYDIHQGPELNYNKYIKYIRPLLFEIFHLLNDEIVREVNSIEDIFERQTAVEEAELGDAEDLRHSYSKILKLIKEQFTDLRASNKNLRNT